MLDRVERVVVGSDRRSPAVQQGLDAWCVESACAGAAGKGFEPSVQQGKTRPHGIVKAATFKARRDNARHNALLKALNAGRV